MKHRYLVFTHNTYYPAGGMRDCRHRTNDLKDARAFAVAAAQDHRQIYDCETGKTVDVKERPKPTKVDRERVSRDLKEAMLEGGFFEKAGGGALRISAAGQRLLGIEPTGRGRR